jgi:hypothetical protein
VDVTTLTGLIEKALETKPFSISGNLLGSASIASCLNAFFGTDVLELENAELKSKSATEVVVGGQMTQALAGLPNEQATVTFTVPVSEAQFELALTTLPAQWAPSTSFAQLKGSVFDEFSWADPVLTLSSAGGPPLPPGYPTGLGCPGYSAAMTKAMTFGLSLTATVSPLAGGGPLEWLLSGTAWQVSGPIVLPASQLSTVLSTAPQPGVTVGGFSIPFAFTLASAAIHSKPADPIVVASVLQLDAEVDRDLGGGTVFTLPLVMREGSASAPTVTVQSALPPGHGITPNEIGALIGGAIGDQVPQSFPALDAIQLERVALTLAPAAQQPLISVSATIGWVTPTPYKIFDGLVTFNGMAVTFTYLPGGYSRPDGTIWHVTTDVAAQATVAGGTLDAALELPDLVFSCVLEPGTSIDISELVRAAAGDSISMPQINCTELAVFGDVTSGTYRFQATVTDDWTFNLGGSEPGSKPLALTEIGLDIDKDPNGFGGEIVCQFEIVRTKLFGRAGYESATGGWTFELGTIEKADVSLTDLAGDILHVFGLDLPSNAPKLTLTALNFLFDSAAHTFWFQCATSLQIAGLEIDMGLEIGTGLFRGLLWVGDEYFEIDFDSRDQSKSLFATWKATDKQGELEFEDIAAVFGWQMPAVPAGLDLALHDAELLYLFDTGTLAISAHSEHYGQVLFVSLGSDAAAAAAVGADKPVYVFSLDVPLNVQLSDLPVVGSKLPADLRLGVQDLELIIASAGLDEKRMPALNKALEGLGDKALIPTTLSAGVTFAANLEMGASTEPVVVPLSGGASQQLAAPAAVTPPPPDASATLKWFDVGKQFGVFSFQRIGVGFHAGELEVGLDAALAVGPIGFSMEALTVSAPLKPTPFVPHFDLKGMALSFDRPPVSIGGEFLKTGEGKDTAYYGEVLVGAATFSLKALGGWRPDPPAFFFLYLNIDVPIGGPPFLFVTGIAGGFGINSRLVLPSIDEVANYPLLPGKAPAQAGTPAETIANVLPVLQQRFTPEPGEYWVAAGLRFTTFEMVDSRVVLSVAFGVEVQIGLVGTSAMTFPTGDPAPVAYVEIDIVASFTPSTGLLAVDGKLSPASYLFGGFVKLTGGFAFYAWFSGEHQGDFVISLGGYHPAFVKPANYPAVPRLGLGFSLGPLKVQGESYFALTPGAFMAGIRMSATFSAGSIKAWFDTGADFLITWAPFHYEADAFAVFGCSVDLGLFTLTVHIGAALEIWGPAFGGQALIDLDVVSFTIGFGAGRSAPPPVGWTTLSDNFLPPPSKAAPPVAMLAAAAVADTDPPPNSVTATVAAGRRAVTAPGVDWVIDPDAFRIVTASAIPANHAEWVTDTGTDELPNLAASYKRLPKPVVTSATTPVPPDMELALDWDTVTYADLHPGAVEVWQPKLHVAPMKKRNVAAYHKVALRKLDPKTNTYSSITGLTVAPQLSPATAALWGPPTSGVQTDPNAPRLVPSALTGLALSPVPRHPDTVSPVPLESLIFGDANQTGFAYQPPIPPSAYKVDSKTSPDGNTFVVDVSGAYSASLPNTGRELSALVDQWVAGQRTAILDELTQLGFATTPSADVKLTTMAETALTAWPHAALIGAPA